MNRYCVAIFWDHSGEVSDFFFESYTPAYALYVTTKLAILACDNAGAAVTIWELKRGRWVAPGHLQSEISHVKTYPRHCAPVVPSAASDAQ